MGIFSDSLLGTQQPPDGSPEPGGVAGFAKAAQPLQTATPQPSFSEAILGSGQQSAPAQEQGQKADERGWLRKGYDAIVGPKDPN
jgi:hypothetical protein